jgi:lipopolysaccharide biosynthesis glycosyltransferase
MEHPVTHPDTEIAVPEPADSSATQLRKPRKAFRLFAWALGGFRSRNADDGAVATERRQRNEARKQRDEARKQRDKLGAKNAELQKELKKLKKQLAATGGKASVKKTIGTFDTKKTERKLTEVIDVLGATDTTFMKLRAEVERLESVAAAVNKKVDDAKRAVKSVRDDFRNTDSEKEKVAKYAKLAKLEKWAKEMKSRFADIGDVNFFANERKRLERSVGAAAKRAGGGQLSVTELETLTKKFVPPFAHGDLTVRCPPPSVAFLTVANDRFFVGLEGLLRSLLEVYPDLQSDIYVYHDGTMTSFAQRSLLAIYPRCRFVAETMDWFEFKAADHLNHKRVGKLGYMNVHAFAHDQYSHVVVLDSDLLILGDISELWASDDAIAVCHDFGDREYVAFSEATSDFVINSGVISVPRRYLGQAVFDEMKQVLATVETPVCPLIDRFADQKAWNLFLANKPKRVLPVNYNCNVRYVAKHMDGYFEGVRILHFAGPKPWNSTEFVAEEYVSTNDSSALTYHELWRSAYRKARYSGRLAEYRKTFANLRTTPVRASSGTDRSTCFLVGNGPSIANTDLDVLADFEKICFNWFVLHEGFDEVRPEHLVLASHMFFGGWNTLNPRFPDGYLEKLLAKKHRPVIWTSFYFKPLFEELGLDKEFECNYLLFEKPFKKFVDRLGRAAMDLQGYLTDGRTGVISFGVPIARHLGFQRIALVGCDSSYNRPETNTNYFYASALHTSPSTQESSLTATWTDSGPGQFIYSVVREQLEAEGREFLDATVNGALQTVPKLDVPGLVKALHVPDDLPASSSTSEGDLDFKATPESQDFAFDFKPIPEGQGFVFDFEPSATDRDLGSQHHLDGALAAESEAAKAQREPVGLAVAE